MAIANLPSKNSEPWPIFSRTFWLEAVAPGQWDVVTISNGEEMQARLPYVLKTGRFGSKMLVMPPLTQTLGPWLAPHDAKYVNQLSQQHELLNGLIEQLPQFDCFEQNFHYSITNCLPFYWRGFQQLVRYTYFIEDLIDLDAVWSETRANIRTDVRKAKKQLVVRSDLDLDTFLDLNEKTFRRQSKPLPYDRELVVRIDRACRIHDCGRMFFAEDAQGRLHAAIYIVWDEQAAYYLLSGSDPELRSSGATSFLLWEAIKFAATVTKTFDFEGSMIQPVERFFRAFGARQKPYYQVTKTNSFFMKVGQDIRSWKTMWTQRH